MFASKASRLPNPLRKAPGSRAGMLLAVSILCIQTTAQAGDAKPSPAEIAAQRQEILDKMLTDAYAPALIAGLRRVCATGGGPAHVAEDRGEGTYFTPDAADECVAALVRTAHDGHLPDLYRELLTRMGGDVTGYERWPRVLGNAVLADSSKVPIGRNKAAEVTPALAFDAGFTVAYQDGKSAKDQSADAKALKAIAEGCLGQHQDAGTCFSVGYMYGAHAFNAQTAAAR